MRKLLIIITGLLLFASCSNEEMRRNFAGSWESISNDNTLFVSEDMVFSLRKTGDNILNLGKAEVSAGEVKLLNSGKFCKDTEGIYFYEIYMDTLQMRVREDACYKRKDILDKSKFLRKNN